MPSPMELLVGQRLAAVVQAPERQALMARAQAAAKGGVLVLALPVSIPFVAEIAAELADAGNVTVALCDVVSAEQVSVALAAGAELILSPVFDLELIQYAAQRGVAVLPSIATPTELCRAVREHQGPIGVQSISLLGGPEHLGMLKRTFPKTQLVAIGGIGPDAAPQYLEIGASAVVVDTGLFPKDLDPASADIIAMRASALLEVCASI